MIIYILCPDNETPSGGVRKLYDHADILTRNGFKAVIVHESNGFKNKWFKSKSLVNYLNDIEPSYRDVLVIPEIYGYNTLNIFPGVRKVIFNLNAFNTINAFRLNPSYIKLVYTHPDVIGILVNSSHDKKYLESITCRPVHRIWNGIDHTLFHMGDSKRKIISLMPRKRVEESVHLLNLLKIRKHITGFHFNLINLLSYESYAKILRESAIFLSLNCNEGFGLPPVEAMGCGCIVIGFDGNAGKEYLKKKISFPISSGDILKFAQTIEKVTQLYNRHDKDTLRIGSEAYKFAHRKYSLQREETSIVTFWNDLF